ncbi:MAG: extra-cytoplasmic solute receptor BugT [Xanthobacteraceae bacterium]|jgi:tripartite-type tricarboxylate transporter receptor subunit TctC|nr:extra-cytoplasmic solute receptor BugT [Xanthobacteraceae bacterium]
MCGWAIAVLAMAVVASWSTGAIAQVNTDKWPERPVRFIVPFPAGSASDLVARVIANEFSTKLGQQFVIENRSGASGTSGSDVLAHAPPDGYTVGLGTSTTLGVAAGLNPKLPYNPVTDFTPISLIGSSPYVLAVAPRLPVQNVKELIALAKANPRTLNYASAGPASLAHLAGELFSQMAQVELTHVPYRSSAQAVTDATEGRIEMQFGTLGPTLELIRAGKLRALAVTGAKRIDSLPDVPTMQEAGLAGYDVELWMAIVMPGGSPPAIQRRLNDIMLQALQSKEIIATLQTQGMQPEPSTPEALTNLTRDEIAKWRNLAKDAGLKVSQ